MNQPNHYRRLDRTMESTGHSSEQYLDATIRTASPARLRLMLIERAVEVSASLADSWRSAQETPGSNELSLKLLDLLNELLSGVTSDESEVCVAVADLYVFLAKHLVAAEEKGDATAIDEIRLVLQTEAETWRMVCANEVSHLPSKNADPASAGVKSGGLNLQA